MLTSTRVSPAPSPGPTPDKTKESRTMAQKWLFTIITVALFVLAILGSLFMDDSLRFANWVFILLGVLVVAGVLVDLFRQGKLGGARP